MVLLNDIMIEQPVEVNDGTPQSRTFVDAIYERYVYGNDFDTSTVQDIITESDTTFFGFSKLSGIQRQLREIFSLDLSNMKISSAGNLEQLNNVLHRVTFLNLANNLLCWRDVVSIMDSLPNLKEVVLTQNNLEVDLVDVDSKKMKRLNTLSLGKTNLPWRSFVTILSKVSLSINQLDLWSCDLNDQNMSLGRDVAINSIVDNLVSLRLSRNNFTHVSWLGDIGRASKLKELDLSSCSLLSFVLSPSIEAQLDNLTQLNISYNRLNRWEDISNLKKLKKLIHLICHENPFFDSEKHAKLLTIGRLGNLKVINREPISRAVQRDAELLYLRGTFSEYKLYREGKLASFTELHPRYNELIDLYGLPEDLDKKQPNDKYLDLDLCYEDKKINRRLPCDMRISNVHMLCKRLFKIRLSSNVKLKCRDLETKSGTVEYELDKDCQTLHFFSVKSGNELIVALAEN